MRQAIAYLRRSRVDTRRPGVLSHEQQLTAIRETAAKQGDDPLVIEDWGKSGRGTVEHRREGFARLRSMIEAGEVGAVYAFDLSRLGRSLETVYALSRRCGELGIPVRCASGYSPDVSTAEGRMVLGVLSSIGEYFAESTRERAHVTMANRRARGDALGPPPFGWRTVQGKHVPNPAEDVAVLVAAYREAGGLGAACKLLNDPTSGYRAPTRKGRPWRPSTLGQILDAAEARPRRPRPGRPTTRTFVASGLLRCHCGTTLLGQHSNRYGTVGYECRRARIDPTHGRPSWVSESQVIDWIRDEAARLSIPDEDPGEVEDELAPDADALADRRRRVIDLYKSGLIDKDERDADLAAIAEALEAIDRTPPVVDFDAGIPWEAPPEAVNGALRALWEHVQLGPDLRPVEALWRVPEWRA